MHIYMHRYSSIDIHLLSENPPLPPFPFLAGARGLHSGIRKSKRHPDTTKDEELFGCLMSGC